MCRSKLCFCKLSSTQIKVLITLININVEWSFIKFRKIHALKAIISQFQYPAHSQLDTCPRAGGCPMPTPHPYAKSDMAKPGQGPSSTAFATIMSVPWHNLLGMQRAPYDLPVWSRKQKSHGYKSNSPARVRRWRYQPAAHWLCRAPAAATSCPRHHVQRGA